MAHMCMRGFTHYLVDTPITQIDEVLIYFLYGRIVNSGNIDKIIESIENDIESYRKRIKEEENSLGKEKEKYDKWAITTREEYINEYESVKLKIKFLKKFLELKDEKIIKFQNILETTKIIEELEALLPKYEKEINSPIKTMSLEEKERREQETKSVILKYQEDIKECYERINYLKELSKNLKKVVNDINLEDL